MGVMAGHTGVHKLLVVNQFPFLPPASLRRELVARESRGRSPREGHGGPAAVPASPRAPAAAGKIFHLGKKSEAPE